MKLTRNQLAEVDNYLTGLVQYRETLQELKDHVLTALSDDNTETFNIQLVQRIVDEDFGSHVRISANEKVCKQVMTRAMFRLLGREMLHTFKWHGSLRNLSGFALCAVYYMQNTSLDPGFWFIIKAMYIVLYAPAAYMLIEKFIMERGRKASMTKDLLRRSWYAMVISVTILLQAIGLMNAYLNHTGKLQLGLFLMLYLLLSMFIRAYMKLYGEKIRGLRLSYNGR